MAMDKHTIINKLAQFGEQEARQSAWPDYSACGFTVDDALTLVEVVGDAELSNVDDDGNDVWIPLHAWRALKPLMPVGLVELLPMMNVLAEDDWASTELPKVIAAAGELAIAPLQAFIRDRANQEYARSMAVDALGEVVRQEAGLREKVISVLAACLQAGANDDLWVNSALVSTLMDCDAVEAIDVIREAYAADKVDWSVCGDVEEVELGLGLREKRDTPAPRYNLFREGNRPKLPSFEPVKNLTLEERLERVEQFLDYYGSQESVGSVTELHGFFTAIGCAPEMVKIGEWIPAMWGGEDLAPDWPDTQSLQVFLELIMPIYNIVMGNLRDVNQFEIPFDTYEFDGVAFTDVSRWCRGFMMGVQVGRVPTVSIPGVETFLDEIADSSSTKDFEKFSANLRMSPAEKKAKERSLIRAVRAICVLGRGGQVTAAPVMHAAAKIGRNDPCPCGSGKKYKKCCLH
jgi:yecA family protein